MLSERERRFAFLVAMMSPADRRGRRRPLLRRETIMDSREQLVTKANKEGVRAGVTGHNARYVLLASIGLVVLVFIVLAAFFR